MMEGPKLNITPDAVTKDRLRKLKAGCVLLARDQLKDPNFDSTVVLISAHNEEGAYGLVLNRPSHMPLSEMFDGFQGVATSKKVYIGGPVRQDELQIVQITDTPAEHAYQIAPRVYQGGKWEDLHEILESNDNASRLFLGYSGWGPRQLEFEIIAGAWEVYNVDLEKLLLGPEEALSGTIEKTNVYLQSITAEDATTASDIGSGGPEQQAD